MKAKVSAPKKARARVGAAKLQAALFQIADAASAARDLPAFYAEMHRIVGALMYAKNFYLSLYDPATRLMNFAYFVDASGDQPPPPLPLDPTDKSLRAHVLRTGKPLHLSRAQIRAGTRRGTFEPSGTMAEDWIGVPLQVNAQTIGALIVQSYDSRVRYTDRDVDLLVFVAQHIAIALTRARALEETRQRVAELAIINSVQHALASQLDIQAIYDLVGDTVRDIFDLQAVIICTFDLAQELEIFHYNYEQGRRYYPAPRQYDATRKKLIASREPILVNRVTPEFLAQVGGQTIEGTPVPKAGIFAPMIVRQEIKGYVSIQNLERFDAFSDADVRLLQTLANAMSVALENARLFDETQTRNREISEALEQQTATSEILRVIACSPTDVQPVMDVIATNAVRLAGADDAAIARVEGDVLRVVAHHGAIPFFAVGQGVSFNRDTVAGRAILDRATLQVANLIDDAEYPLGAQVAREYGYRTILCVPLLRDDTALGVITIRRIEERPFDAQQIALLKTFADQAVIAIENVRLFNETNRLLSETQQRAAELQIINSVQQGLASKLEMQAIYDLVGEKIREIFDAQAVMMVGFDYATERGHITYMWEKGARFYPPPSPFTQFIRHIIRTRQVVSFKDDFRRRAQEFGMHLVAGDWSKSAVYVPLVVGEVATGLISLHNMDRENAFSESDVRLLETLANAMSIALENARLFAAERERAAELAVINRVQAGLANQLDFHAIIDLVGDKIRETFNAQNLSIGTYTHSTRVVDYSYVVQKGVRVYFEPMPFSGVADYLISTRHPLVVNENVKQKMDELGSHWGAAEIPLSLVYVPLLVGDLVTGVVAIYDYKREHAFSESNVRLLQTLANAMSLALENARLFEQVRTRNREISAALDRETATNNILRVIAESPTDVQPVLNVVVENAARLSNSNEASIFRVNTEGLMELAAYFGADMTVPLGTTFPINRDSVAGRSISGKTLVHIPDFETVTEEYPLSQSVHKTTYRAFLSIPLLRESQCIGVIFIRRTEALPFTEKQINLVNTFADQAVIAIENVRLFNETKRLLSETEQRAAELQIINSVQQGLASQLDMQAIYDLVGAKIMEIFNADVVGIGFFDPARKLMNHPYVVDHGERYFPEPTPISDHYMDFVRTHGAVLIHTHEQAAQLMAELGVQNIGGPTPDNSQIAVPLLINNQFRGRIVVAKLAAYAFTESDLRLLQTLASSMSVALENARLFDELQTRNREISEALEQQTATSEILRVIAQSPTDVQPVLDVIVEHAVKLCDASFSNLYRTDGKMIYEAAQYNFPKEAVDESHRAYPAPLAKDRLSSRCILERSIIHIPNLGDDPNLPQVTRRYVNALKMNCLVMIPLMREDEAIGCIGVGKTNPDPYTDKQIALLQTFADQAVIAIENVRLFNETKRLLSETQQRAAELAIINNIGAALAQQLDLQRVIELVGEKIRDVFDAQAVGIALHDQKHKQILYPYTWNRGRKLDLPSGKVGGLGGHVITTRQTLIVNRDFAQRAVEYRSRLMVGPDYPQAGVYVPILIGENALGVLTLLNYERENVFTDSDVRLLETIAASMGVAIQNARLFEELQMSLTTTTRLSELSAQMLSATSVEATARFITRALQEAFAADVVSLNLLEANGQFRYWDSDGLPEQFYQRGQPRSDGITRRAMDLAEPLIIQTPELLSPATRALGVQSTIALPLRDEKSSLGVLFLNYRAFREFDPREIDALSLFANQTALAVKRLRLIEETAQRAAELAIINRVSQASAGQLELGALIQLVGDQMRETFHADIVYVALLDRDTNLIHFPYYNEHGDPRVEPPLIFGQGLTSKIIETRQHLMVNRDIEKKRSELGVVRRGTPAQAYLGVPILVSDQAIGVISVQSTQMENAFDDSDVRLLSTLAANVGVAIRTAQLYQEVQHGKQYFQALVENSPVAIVTIDLNGNVTEWNPGAEKLFGYTRAEALGCRVDDLVARNETLHAEATGFSQRGLTQSGIFHAITKRNRKDESFVDVDLWGVPIFVGDQRVGVYAMYVDISELQRARQDAIAANEAKSAFLATMSHEIRTPMNAIIGMSGLLLNTNLSNDQREFAEVVRNSGEGLLTIINDILDFSKIEAAKMELENAPFDLRDAMESSLDLVAAPAAEKGIDLACVIEDGVPSVIIGDVTRFRQILLNLLNNAVKFTERGEVVVTVSAEENEGNKGNAGKDGNKEKDEFPSFPSFPSLPSYNLHFSVHDTGIGIPPDRIDRLFQSFTQVDASTTRKYGGTGLGLAISKRLVELMDGTMWVESEPGQGATFHFTLTAQTAPELQPRPRIARDHSPLIGKRVLIVDDNDTNRHILSLQTRSWEMLPRDTGSPREALDWITRGDPFDLAILDLQMPELDGLMLARAIREYRDARALPLVLFSSMGQRSDETDALGFVAFLKKPLKQSQLFDALIAIFGSRASAPKPETIPPHLDATMATRVPLRILLAEDNAVNQKLALRLLSQLGYRADVAANGVETLRALERQPYDVVLMDVQMPEMDGLEATRQIVQQWARAQRPRIVAMTANAMQGDREMCLAAGMDDYISKPIRVDELIRALSESRVTS